jgi:hypothetical protein
MSEQIQKMPPEQPDSTGEGVVRSREMNLVRRAINARWDIPTAVKQEAVTACRSALTSEDGRVAMAAAKTLVAMEGQNQADDHTAEKYARIDSDKPTDRVAMKLYGVDAPVGDV